MTYNVLIYGANGHSGRMIVRQALDRQRQGKLSGVRLILAGRSPEGLSRLARHEGLSCRVFPLGDRREVIRNLVGVDLVVNTAGPFALTALRLAKAAIEVGCSYVDVNGEVDVYMKMDDLARQAEAQGVALVSSAGHTAGASCLLLDYALDQLEQRKDRPKALKAIRIALSSAPDLSRGSVVTGLRLLREQVLTVRRGEGIDQYGEPRQQLVKWHEPVGHLERSFDFGDLGRDERHKRGPRRVASASNMVDTLVALQRLERSNWYGGVESIESYLEMDAPARAGYQLGGLLAPLMSVPLVAAEARMLSGLLTSDRPSAGAGAQSVVLEIDGPHHERLVELRLRVKSGYDFTARLVVALIREFELGKWNPGWKTPAEILRPHSEKEPSRITAMDLATYGDLVTVRI